jgi:type II secretory pathway predicted ATPase ExeA
MFEAFYKLSTNPFRLTPDPKFCFRHPSYNQAYAYLQYALRLGEGFIMVTGRPGIGKTTLAEVFLTEIEHSEVLAARIASANVEAADLLRVVAYSYGIDVEGLDKATVLLRLEQFFIQETRSGKRVLLIIDEAQGLPHIALEELRLLADLQMDSRPLLQLFLVGQEKLRGLMREPDMEQFQQRVIGACHLEPLDLMETRSYMEHRLRTAGWKGDPELTGAAVLALYQYSKGVPRHVNKICTRLLLHGMLEETHELHKEDVLSVEQELRAEQLAPMERDETVPTDPAKAAGVPELEGGSLSIADLALRVDQREAEQQEAGDHPVTAAVSEVANQLDATPGAQEPELAAVSSERSTARILPQETGWGPASTDSPGLRNQHSRQRLSGVGEFPGQLRRRPRQARATVSPREAAPQVKPRTARRENAVKGVKTLLAKSGTWRSVMSAPSITFSQYAGETVRMVGRLKWKGKLAVLVGALLVVNLITAVLMTRFMEDSGDHQSLLVGYPEPMQKDVSKDQLEVLTAPTEGHKNSGMGSRETDPRLAAGKDSTASTQTASSARQQADDGQDDWFASIADSWDHERVIASPRGRPLEQPVSESVVTDTSVQETELTVAEPDRATVESVVASGSGTKQSDIQLKVRQQIDEDHSSPMLASVEPPSKSGTVQLPDGSSPADAAHTARPTSLNEGTTMAAATEALATLDPVVTSSVSDEADRPVSAEKKPVPPPVSRQEKITELLALGHQSLKRDRLLIPTHDSAYKYYQQTLILDPGNDAALFGIERIVARYTVLARKALERQDKNKSSRYIDRGLSINPTDKRLLTLRDSLNTPVAVVEPQVQPPVVQTEQQTPAAEPKPQPGNFLSRMKAFFTRGQSAARRNEVVVEERR